MRVFLHINEVYLAAWINFGVYNTFNCIRPFLGILCFFLHGQLVLIGQTVKIKVLEVDRSKVNACTLLTKVLQVLNKHFYRLGTKAGKLSQLFESVHLMRRKFFRIINYSRKWNWYSSNSISTLFDWWTRINMRCDYIWKLYYKSL